MGNSHQDRFNNPDYGTQIVKSGTDDNLCILHEVSSGNTLFLRTVVLENGDSAGCSARIYVNNDQNTEAYTIAQIGGNVAAGESASSDLGQSVVINFATPLAIPAGYEVRLMGYGYTAYGFILGTEE